MDSERIYRRETDFCLVLLGLHWIYTVISCPDYFKMYGLGFYIRHMSMHFIHYMCSLSRTCEDYLTLYSRVNIHTLFDFWIEKAPKPLFVCPNWVSCLVTHRNPKNYCRLDARLQRLDIGNWSNGNNSSRVDRWMGPVVMGLDMIEIGA